MQRELNEQQKEAVSLLEGPALVLAGAGSGKTRVVTERIVQLILSGVAPESILGLTFTNKAAKEMQERIQKLCSSSVWISTFHRLGARILRESIAVLGYQPNFLILDEEDADKVIKSCLEKMGILEGKGDKKRFRQEISRQKNAEGIRESRELPNGLYSFYCEELKRLNAVDFDDLLLLPLKILKEHPPILEIYKSRWQFLLVDEYQDTNGVQDQLIQLLAGDRRNLFVVGDPDQAIYSWRGANIRNILEFERCYPGAKVIRLEQNYRSQSHILDAANALISHNEARYEKNLWSTKGAGSKLKKIRANDEREEAFKIAEMISSKRRQAVPYREMAVLYRTNAQSRPFEDQLLARGIPYIVVGGISFYQRKEIKDILAYLRLLVSEQDPISFERTLLLRKQGLGVTSLKKILQGALEEGMPVLSYAKALVSGSALTYSVSLPKKAKEALTDYCLMMERLKNQAEELGVCEILRAVIEESSYLEFLKADPETYQDRRENIDELIAKAAEWDVEERGGLIEFFEELSLKSNLDADTDIETDRLSLMTVHNSKGLEFDVVFLSGLEEDLFPHVNSRGSDSALEEERRLCYVAMTRAREELILSYCLLRYLFGTERYQTPSRFLREIPQHYFSTS